MIGRMLHDQEGLGDDCPFAKNQTAWIGPHIPACICSFWLFMFMLESKVCFFLMLKASQFGMISFGCMFQAQVLVHVSHLGPGTSEGMGNWTLNYRAVYVRFPTPPTKERSGECLVLVGCVYETVWNHARPRDRERVVQHESKWYDVFYKFLLYSMMAYLKSVFFFQGQHSVVSKVLVLVTLYLQNGLHNPSMEICTGIAT